MNISHPYLFLINKTPEHLEQVMEALQKTSQQTINLNGHLYNVNQLLEMLKSTRTSKPIFYKCVNGTFIKYEPKSKPTD